MSDIIESIRKKRSVTSEDVLKLRGLFYGDGGISSEEAEFLFDVNGYADSASAAWPKLFSEALTDYLVTQVEPRGYVDQAKADWLLARISADGVVHRGSELDALITIIERAKSVPPSLSSFALKQVYYAVIDGTGAGRWGRPGVAGIITADDVTLLRRILYAYGGEGHVAITRAEAEVLFDLNDRTAEIENHPDWSDLFVKAIANAIMFASGYTIPTRDEALRRTAWVNDTSTSLTGFFSRMLTSNLESFRSAYGLEGYSDHAERAEVTAHVAERVTDEEAHWLATRIGRDGILHENEKALLHFIRDEAPDMPPVLQTLIDSAA
ncbi:MAG: hypothetical protein AAF619_10175 [Pseudomonadota bacterium]